MIQKDNSSLQFSTSHLSGYGWLTDYWQMDIGVLCCIKRVQGKKKDLTNQVLGITTSSANQEIHKNG